jgi:hypothetical protein
MNFPRTRHLKPEVSVPGIRTVVASASRCSREIVLAIVKTNIKNNVAADTHMGNGNRAARRMGRIPEKRYPANATLMEINNFARRQCYSY